MEVALPSLPSPTSTVIATGINCKLCGRPGQRRGLLSGGGGPPLPPITHLYCHSHQPPATRRPQTTVTVTVTSMAVLQLSQRHPPYSLTLHSLKTQPTNNFISEEPGESREPSPTCGTPGFLFSPTSGTPGFLFPLPVGPQGSYFPLPVGPHGSYFPLPL